MLNRIAVHVPDNLRSAVEDEINNWKKSDKVSRIWQKDATVWTSSDEAKWLGWLDIVDEELGTIEQYREFYSDISSSRFEHILLMGMGGSSLCPEVLSITFGKSNFHILDSTVPAQLKAVENSIDVEKTLFIVASKSGSTLEPNCFKQYFFDRVSQNAGKENAGKQFVAITDPGSKMEQVARSDGFRYVFYGKPEIGGRFSALSAFGLAAAAAMGIDVEQLLLSAKAMVDACRIADDENPGLLLGTILGICQKNGRDKLTIFTGEEIHDLGAWLEQLLAESTGKDDIAIIPVDREPLLAADMYSSDRVFASLTTKHGNISQEQNEILEELKKGGHPVIEIELDSIASISQEFFRWEFATAVAGSIMGINTFNQPDVESAKVETRKLTEEYEKSGSLPEEEPFFDGGEFQLFTSDEYRSSLAENSESFSAVIKKHLEQICEGDYFALLAYIQMSSENEVKLQAIRKKVLERAGNATCLGFGPRFLHSTGQAYKGGGNNGVFLQITSDDEFDIPVPGQKFTFGVVKSAQARGDFQVLLDRGRRALRVHIKGNLSDGLDRLFNSI